MSITYMRGMSHMGDSEKKKNVANSVCPSNVAINLYHLGRNQSDFLKCFTILTKNHKGHQTPRGHFHRMRANIFFGLKRDAFVEVPSCFESGVVSSVLMFLLRDNDATAGEDLTKPTEKHSPRH